MDYRENKIWKVCQRVNVALTLIVTRSWDYGRTSKDAYPEKDFKKINVLCIKKGAVTAKVS